jgi:hypothetical protein
MKTFWTPNNVRGLIVIIGLGLNCAHAAILKPINLGCAQAQTDPDSVCSISVSVLQEDGSQAPEDWLPEPGKSVTLTVMGSPNPSLKLVPSMETSAQFRTTNYPGTCTNCPVDLASQNVDDFTLEVTQEGYRLTANDYGGIAVLIVNDKSTVIFPPDSDDDGMPDSWEAQFCPKENHTCLPKEGDEDGGGGSGLGDGIANLDEYRGFMLGGKHIRTHPLQKDLFLHIVKAQCGTVSLLDDANFLNKLYSLIPPQQVHLLSSNLEANNRTSDEWVDGFVEYDPRSEMILPKDRGASDRSINEYAAAPFTREDKDDKGEPITVKIIQKGIRLIECLDPTPETCTREKPCLLGWSGWSPVAANAVVYTQRIVEHITKRVRAAKGVVLRASTFDPALNMWGPGEETTLDELISQVIQFYVAMEVGHSLGLTSSTQSQGKYNYSYHYAPHTGDNLDYAITSSRKKGELTFFIPSHYNSNGHLKFQIKN